MTLIDTSRWAGHLRQRDAIVAKLISDKSAGGHPFVLGELATGNLRNRSRFIADFQSLPQLKVTDEVDVHYLLEARRLWGKGLSWIDLHLLAATTVAGWSLYTGDRAMAEAARQIGIECL